MFHAAGIALILLTLAPDAPDAPDAPAARVTDVRVRAPVAAAWVLARHTRDAHGERREWRARTVAPGSSAWIVTEQRIHFGSSAAVRSFLGIQFAQARLPCGEVRAFLNPDPVDEAEARAFIGRFSCDEPSGSSLVTAVDQWVIIADQVAWVVTSRRPRVPRLPLAGDAVDTARWPWNPSGAEPRAVRVERRPPSVRIRGGRADVCIASLDCAAATGTAAPMPLR